MIFNILKKVAIGLFLGCSISIYLLQNSTLLKTALKDTLLAQNIFSEIDSKFNISKVNLFKPSLEITDISLKDHNGEWQANCNKFKISANWISLFLKKEINLDIKLQDSEITSKIIENRCVFVDYLTRHLKPRGFKIKTTIKSIKSDNMLLNLSQDTQELNVIAKLSLLCKQKENILNVVAGINESTIHYKKYQINSIFGNASSTINIDNIKASTSNFKLYFKTENLESKSYTLSGKTEDSKLFAKLKGDDSSIFFNCIIAKNLTGNITLKKGNLEFDGFLNLHEDKSVDIVAHNKGDIFFPMGKFFIKPWGLKFRLTSKDLIDFSSNINLELVGNKDNLIKIDSNILATNTLVNGFSIKANGHINELVFNANADPDLNSCNFEVISPGSTKLINFASNKSGINIVISSEIIKFLNPEGAKLLNGKSMLNLTAEHHKNGKFIGRINSEGCSIILPNSYSIITGLNTEFKMNLKTRELKFKNSIITLNRGEIESKASKIVLGGNGEITHLFVPVIVKGLTLNLNKELVATLSTSLILKKELDATTQVYGDIVIQNLFIKDMDSLFERKHSGTKSLTRPNLNININISSKKAIPLKNDQIEFKALINLQAKGILGDHELSGVIDIISGKVKFPYKNLKISGGKINIGNKETNLDITAKNKIKKYRVNAHIHGNAKSPTITLSSIPYLSEKQIGSLLISGSENSSLNIMVPTILMQNFQNLFYKSSASKSIAPNIKSLKPLKNIKLITRIDEHNDHIIKGGVEIDLSDKISASIEKNLDLNENTSVEIDYAPSDDINIKGLKDENGDLSGEVEFRWRF